MLVLDASQEEIADAVKDVAQTFTGTGGLIASDLVDLSKFSTAVVTGTVDLATIVNGAAGEAGAGATPTPGVTPAPTPAPSQAECSAVAPPPPASSCSVVTTTIITGAESTLVTSIAPVASGAPNQEADAGADAGAGAGAGAAGGNLQQFTGTLGGPAPPVESGAGNRPFSVNGNSFPAIGPALVRSCDIQNNQCFNAVNSGELDIETSECQQQLEACKAAGSGSALRRRQAAGAFGSCSDPTIVFATGLDGRKEAAFKPSNDADFNHGSAQKIGIIASFICQRLADSCKADASVIADCASAQAEAVAATQDQTAADIFNAGLVGSGANNGPAKGPANAPAKGPAEAPAKGPAKGPAKNPAQDPAVTAPPAATPTAAAGAVVTTVTVCN